MASVELSHVCKRFDDTVVVDDLSLMVESGEFLVLVGPSGCGKSTTLRMIAGLEEVSEGALSIGGRRVEGVPPKDRDIGMVFQSYALYPHMSVFENIAFGLRLRKLPSSEIEQRVREVAGQLGLAELLQRKPANLSGGQRQRVAMGRAIARQPSVFLFDEPLSNLDASLRVQMRAELLALHRRLGTTMVYVTHDQVEAMTLATRIAVLKDGVLQQVGRPLDLYASPANRFVAGFMGSPSMNFLDGGVEEGASGPVFRSKGGLVLPLEVEGDLGGVQSVGIRPQDIKPVSGTGVGRVVVVEAMGWEGYAHLQVGNERLVVRLEGAAAGEVRVGEELPFHVLAAKQHLFDASGATLGQGGA